MQFFSSGKTFFIYLFFSFSHNLASQTTQQWIQNGDSLHEEYDTEGAYKAYKNAWELSGDNFEAAWRIAGELIDLGDALPKSTDQEARYTEAVLFARKAVTLNPDHSEGHLILALAIEKCALYKTGKEKLTLLGEVKTEAKKTLELNAQQDLAHCLIGRWNRSVINANWLVKGMVKLIDRTIIADASNEQAVDHFQQAVRINGAYPPYYLELGKTFTLMEKWDEAQTAFQKAADLSCPSKFDRKWKREAKNYIQLLTAHRYSDLKDAVEE